MKKNYYGLLIGCLSFLVVCCIGTTKNVSADENNLSTTLNGNADVSIELSTIYSSPVIGYHELSEFGVLSSNTTAPTYQTFGPYYYTAKGSELTSGIATWAPPSMNLEAAARQAVLNKYGKIDKSKTYKIKWYNRVEVRVSSVNGKIVNYTCVN